MGNIKMESKVKWYKEDKGFGFIRPPIGLGKDIFFHISKVKDRIVLQPGDVVSFTTAQEPKGICAVDISLVSRAEKPEQTATV